jgi:hypothetical protein
MTHEFINLNISQSISRKIFQCPAIHIYSRRGGSTLPNSSHSSVIPNLKKKYIYQLCLHFYSLLLCVPLTSTFNSSTAPSLLICVQNSTDNHKTIEDGTIIDGGHGSAHNKPNDPFALGCHHE